MLVVAASFIRKNFKLLDKYLVSGTVLSIKMMEGGTTLCKLSLKTLGMQANLCEIYSLLPGFLWQVSPPGHYIMNLS